MLGVATLIIVMAVMNGFRAAADRQDPRPQRPMIVQPMDTKLTDYADGRRSASPPCPGVKSAIPLVEGQALASGTTTSSGVLVRGIRQQDLPKVARHLQQHPPRHARQISTSRAASPSARGWRPNSACTLGDKPDAGLAARQRHAARRHAADQGLSGGGDLRDRHVGIRFRPSSSCRSRRRRPISTSKTRRARSRST